MVKNKSLALLQALGTLSKQKLKVITWLIENAQDNEVIATTEQIALSTGVPLGTTTRVMQSLRDSDLIYRDGEPNYLGKLLANKVSKK